MLAVHTILHPTDFYERSHYAFGLACALARDYGARLIVLHVVAVPTVVYAEGVVPPHAEELRDAAQEVMTRGVECARPADSIARAAERMRELNVGSLPVCGENDKLAGMITDRDITVRAMPRGATRPAPASVT
jgi:nucleotide-binding universal stress UspA family protein